ncbi:MAG TPA: glycosyltransferase family 39 protein [Candidatus Methylomirabilis sp.]|nr:glycosyltransferase family 39 protein [Candidatus Methylomirabilis sp.]HSB80713.1 glycosyltransferase family 39 protein [Candidatus Methylomirabilis sp.]HSC71702.1 glycosyltransferase family 39 protein [Candidatus Methylomirabilis sp.]
MTSGSAPIPGDRRIKAATLLALLLLSGTLFFFRLGTPGLFDADEPAYAQAAREMLETGDWITPHFNGRPRFDKPILFYWLLTLGYRVFGVTELAARFWSALAAVSLVVLLAGAGARWFGPRAGWVTGLAITLNLLTALLARAAVTDMLLTLFVAAAILAGVQGIQEDPARGRRWVRAAWTVLGLAVLVKGPVALLISGMALMGSLVVFRELRTGLRRLLAWEALALFALIAFPWYGLALAMNGRAFIEGFVIKHHVTRFAGVVSGHPGPLWFYLPVALVGFFPWSALLPRALWRAGTVGRAREARDPAERLLVVCACWALGVFLFFSLAGTKLPSYLFPAFPAMALLAGASAISNEKPTTDNRPTRDGDLVSVVGCPVSIGSVRQERVPRWLSGLSSWLIGLTGFTLAVGFALAPVLLERFRPMAGGVLDGVALPAWLSWWLAGLLALGTAAGLLTTGAWRVGFLGAMMVLLVFTAEAVIAPRVHGILQGPLREFSQEAGRLLGPEEAVVTYGLNAPSIVFYSGRRVIPLGASLDGEGRLRRMAETGRRMVVITRGSHIGRLDQLPGLVRLGSRGGYAAYTSGPGEETAGGR